MVPSDQAGQTCSLWFYNSQKSQLLDRSLESRTYLHVSEKADKSAAEHLDGEQQAKLNLGEPVRLTKLSRARANIPNYPTCEYQVDDKEGDREPEDHLLDPTVCLGEVQLS